MGHIGRQSIIHFLQSNGGNEESGMIQKSSKDQAIHKDQSVIHLLQRASDRRCTPVQAAS